MSTRTPKQLLAQLTKTRDEIHTFHVTIKTESKDRETIEGFEERLNTAINLLDAWPPDSTELSQTAVVDLQGLNQNARDTLHVMEERYKPRYCRLSRELEADGLGKTGVHLLIIRQGEDLSSYILQKWFDGDADVSAFTLEKIGDNGEDSVKYNIENVLPLKCECKGFLNHGHCKHLKAIEALQEKGRLPKPYK